MRPRHRLNERNAVLVALYRENPSMTLEQVAAHSVRDFPDVPITDIGYLSRLLAIYGARRPRAQMKPRVPNSEAERLKRDNVLLHQRIAGLRRRLRNAYDMIRSQRTPTTEAA